MQIGIFVLVAFFGGCDCCALQNGIDKFDLFLYCLDWKVLTAQGLVALGNKIIGQFHKFLRKSLGVFQSIYEIRSFEVANIAGKLPAFVYSMIAKAIERANQGQKEGI